MKLNKNTTTTFAYSLEHAYERMIFAECQEDAEYWGDAFQAACNREGIDPDEAYERLARISQSDFL